MTGPGRHHRPPPPGTTPSPGRLVSNITGHLLNGVTEPVLQRAFRYRKNVNQALGEPIEKAVHNAQA